LFERPDIGEAAVLVIPSLHGAPDAGAIAEFRDLAVSAGARPVAIITAARHRPDPAYFIGKGKAEEIRIRVADLGADVVLMNHALSPAQERNLERLVARRVVDRTGVILDIFAQRASTFEGKLQVELAQLRHLSTRLVRGWTHLERQKGGIGLRGPGETQLETDRRLIGNRIRLLHERLEKVRAQRAQRRRSRKRVPLPQVALVGYTNAGKSTLFNRLTGASVYVADQLFATLDPTLRRVELPRHGPVVVSDTVGFIRDLPHDLVAAFRATLEEAREAELLLHVIDASDEERLEHGRQVSSVLREIGADHIPRIDVFNKVDLLVDETPRVERDDLARIRAVWLSAVSGAGVDALLAAVSDHLGRSRRRMSIRLPPSAGDVRAALYRAGTVRRERAADNGDWLLEIDVGPGELERAGVDLHAHAIPPTPRDARDRLEREVG
jgi:GTP-binding protein HflX